MRSSALSDPTVISLVRENFVPFALNVTKDGFPSEHIPALAHYKRAYETNWRFSFGFAGCGVVDCEGNIPLGHSTAAGLKSNSAASSTGEDSGYENWVEMLLQAMERHDQVLQMRSTFAQGNFVAGHAELQQLVLQLTSEAQKYMAAAAQTQAAMRDGGLEQAAAELGLL
jgi:hypothetical protein